MSARRADETLRSTGAALIVAVALSTTTASAETCLEQTRRLAEEYELSIDPPELPADRSADSVPSKRLGGSDGVIEPPPGEERSVIEPPEEPRSGMPTVPAIPPSIPEDRLLGEGKPAEALSPAARTTLEALLTAARAEARRDREEDCFERLNEAKAYIRRARERS